MVCTVGGDPGAAKIARDRARTEQQIAEAIISNEKKNRQEFSFLFIFPDSFQPMRAKKKIN